MLFVFRYVRAGGSQTSLSFLIPLEGCGTSKGGDFGRTIENIIVIQSDDSVQVFIVKFYKYITLLLEIICL